MKILSRSCVGFNWKILKRSAEIHSLLSDTCEHAKLFLSVEINYYCLLIAKGKKDLTGILCPQEGILFKE
jgi:hypothetical protein